MEAGNTKTHITKRGLTLPITGEPEQKIEQGPKVSRVAILADDYVGMRPSMKVQVGDRVKLGQALFEDRKTPGVLFTAPGAGTVSAINRGDKRAFQSICIDLDEGDAPEEMAYESYGGKDPANLSSDEARAAMIECGLWTCFRARPHSKIPPVGSSPRSIFVTATDTNPLAPAVEVVLQGKEKDFELGLSILTKFPDGGKVYLCKRLGSPIGAGANGDVEVHEFDGPHRRELWDCTFTELTQRIGKG